MGLWWAALSHSGGACEETNVPVGNIMVLNSAWPYMALTAYNAGCRIHIVWFF